MNHFDDRQSYFAFLLEQGKRMDCLDNNQQQDQSLCTYGGQKPAVLLSDMKQDA